MAERGKITSKKDHCPRPSPIHSQLFFLPRLVINSFVDLAASLTWDPGLKSKPQAQTHLRKPG